MERLATVLAALSVLLRVVYTLVEHWDVPGVCVDRLVGGSYVPGEGKPSWSLTNHERGELEWALQFIAPALEAATQPAGSADPPPPAGSDDPTGRTGPPPPGGEPANPGPPVVLGKPTDEPIVNGKRKPRLTAPRYDVIRALLAAGEDGLSKDSLATESGHSDAVGIT